MVVSGAGEPLRPAGMRDRNLAVVLAAVAEQSPITRAQVATATGLTKSSVSGLVTELLAAGLVAEEGARREGDRGRPGTVLALRGAGAVGLGLEANVDYLAAGLGDLTGRLRYHHIVTVDNRGRDRDAVLAELAGLAQQALAAAVEQGLTVAGACVAVPGVVDATTHRVVRAPNLGWVDFALVERLAAVLPTTPLGTSLENEANVAALGELWFGAGRELGDFVHVSGEVGIGGGIVVDGALFRGSHGMAGEIGHVVVDPDGPECSCGGRGCLERVAGQEAILALAGLAGSPRRGPRGRGLDDLVALLEAGQPQAVAAVQTAARHLGVALASVTNVLDPDSLVLGGGFAALGPWLRDPLEATLHRHVGDSGRRRPRVVVSLLGADAAVRGAAGMVTRSVIASPATFVAASGG
ncbi:MAG TPA: ROK family transcriptional regulator [Actinomycetes bacterium]